MSVADIVDREKIAEKLAYLNGTKTAIADAINYVGEGRGISVSSADTFRSYADKIRSIGKVEIGEAHVRLLSDKDENNKRCKIIEAPEGTAWSKVKVYIDAWSAAGSKTTVDWVLLNTKPSDWNSGWRNYYTKNGDSYEPLATDTPPEFVADTYYNRVETPPTNNEALAITQNGYYDINEYSKKELGQDNEYETASSFYVDVHSAELGPFRVQFLDEDGNVLQTYNDIPYGGWARFKGTPPASKYNLPFQGWNPAPNSITANIKCRPTYYEPQMVADEITDSWAEIVANKGKDYPIGSYKTLPLNIAGNEKIHWSPDYRFEECYPAACVDIPVGLRNPIMMKVANGEDVSTSTWISVWMNANDSLPGPFVLDQCMDTHVYSMDNRYTNMLIVEDINKKFGWPTCSLRHFLNNEFLETIPAYIRQAIVPVTKYSCTAYAIANDAFTATPYQDRFAQTMDTIWIPSAREIAFNGYRAQMHPNKDFAGEGIQYTDFNEFMLANFDSVPAFKPSIAYMLRDAETFTGDDNRIYVYDNGYHVKQANHILCYASMNPRAREQEHSWIATDAGSVGTTWDGGVAHTICIGFCL